MSLFFKARILPGTVRIAGLISKENAVTVHKAAADVYILALAILDPLLGRNKFAHPLFSFANFQLWFFISSWCACKDNSEK